MSDLTDRLRRFGICTGLTLEAADQIDALEADLKGAQDTIATRDMRIKELEADLAFYKSAALKENA